tara:strand:- start:487 stop:1512 length:1026 start_codon:yes stop_codon:yes gene_type:complete
MKKVIIYSLLISGLLFTGCKKDEESEDVVAQASETSQTISLESTSGDATLNAEEKKAIPISTLESGLKLGDGTKKDGLPSAPNTDLGLELSSTDVEGFQETGFSLDFGTTADVAGAYLRIKDVDGNYTDGYYDVTELDGDSYRKGDLNKTKNRREKKVANDTYSVNVAFTEAIPAGQFCVEICVYDYDNNIGQIQTVCIEVESWGGLEALAGNYKAVQSKSIENGSEDLELFEASEWNIEIKADGTYIETFNWEDEEGSDENGTDVYYGKWAYNEEDETLTTIDFYNEETYNGVTETYDFENGSLYFEGLDVTVVDNQMTWSYEEIYEGITDTYAIVFELK